jgi:hypothetical protein
VDESWIKKPIDLIPRMKQWVSTYYPGTKLAITEYNWGAENNINGGTAQADVLGIFGREGLDMATRWTAPDPSTFAYKAMKIYRNYDGNKSTFGDVSVQDIAPDPDNVASFAALRSSDHALTVIVIDKNLTNSATLAISLAHYNASGAAQAWQITSSNAIAQIADAAISADMLDVQVPAQSITLYVVSGVPEL